MPCGIETVAVSLRRRSANKDISRFAWLMHVGTANIHLYDFDSQAQEQIAANAKVVKTSKGMLAPITGDERVLTLGTGHCAAFCKAGNAGCRTPLAYLQDAAGKINLAWLKMQPDYKVMLEDGWVFAVLPWQVEAAWPGAPDVLQRALNSTSDVHSSVTELEGAVTIAEALESGETQEDAIAQAISGEPLWRAYADILAELCRRYGGGQKVPLLHKLDGFAKKHGENRRLGEEYLSAVVRGFKYADPTVQVPRVVDMLLTVNMVSPKVVDGIARCVTKTDVQVLSNKSKLAVVLAAEKHLERAEELCDYIKTHHPSAARADAEFIDKIDSLEGLFKVRLGAYITKKGVATFEGKNYDNMDAVVQVFLKEAYDAIAAKDCSGFTLPMDAAWQEILLKAKPCKEKEPAPAAATKLRSMEELKSTEAVADRQGLKPGVKVYEKTVGSTEGHLQTTTHAQYIQLSTSCIQASK